MEGGDGDEAMSGMATSFQLSTRMGEVLLPGLNIVTTLDYLLLCLLTVALCFLKEYLYSRRLQLHRQQRAIALIRRQRKSSRSSLPSQSPQLPPHMSAAAGSGSGASVQLSFPAEQHEEEDEDTDAPLVTPRHLKQQSASAASASFVSSLLPSSSSLLPSLLYGVNVALGYLVMLLVMTYNAGIFLLIVLATAAAHYAFTVRGERRDERTEGRRRRSAEEGAAGGERFRPKPQRQLGRRVSAGSEKGGGRGGGREEAAELTDDLDDDDVLNKDCCEK